MRRHLQIGAAVEDITPTGSVFLFGYPHVRRYSTGVHDRLYSSALYVRDGKGEQAIFIANDLIYVGKASAARVRREIEHACGVPSECVMVTATHTHSGPVTMECMFSLHDPVVPRTDESYVRWAEDKMVQAATKAVKSAVDAEIGLAVADAAGVGTNRRDPRGPSDMNVPVLLARSVNDHRPIAAMLVCCMHPTVLHEDSTLISGDDRPGPISPSQTRNQFLHQRNTRNEHILAAVDRQTFAVRTGHAAGAGFHRSTQRICGRLGVGKHRAENRSGLGQRLLKSYQFSTYMGRSKNVFTFNSRCVDH